MNTLTCCQDHILSENVWFVWSETSYGGHERRCYRCGTNEQQRTLKIELLSQWMIEAEFRNDRLSSLIICWFCLFCIERVEIWLKVHWYELQQPLETNGGRKCKGRWKSDISTFQNTSYLAFNFVESLIPCKTTQILHRFYKKGKSSEVYLRDNGTIDSDIWKYLYLRPAS